MQDLDPLLISVIALVCALPLVWWLARRGTAAERPEQQGERLDTLQAWPPEPMRILRSSERLAFSTLKLALPGYMILAQVPISRFIAVPKRNSYAEWMRRLGSQCVDFVVCDVTSQVVAVVEIRPPAEQIDERVKGRFDRVTRILEAAGIAVHIWNEQKLPTIESARAKILPEAPAVPRDLIRRSMPTPPQLDNASAAAAFAAGGVVFDAVDDRAPGGGGVVSREAVVVEASSAVDPFADTDRDWSNDEAEVIEVREPPVNTWYDDLDEPVSAELPPQPSKPVSKHGSRR